jgi:archaellum component FlaC
MAALMSSMRQYLDQQNARHDELLTYLSQLSNALQSIPDTGRVQSETLRVLHQQIAFQNAQHKQLSEMLRKVSESSGTQHEIVETLRDRVETLYKNDQQIADTIHSMGDSVTVVSQQSQTNSMVLERLRDNLVNRDGELEQAIRRENRWTRSTLMLVGAASIAALIISVGMALYSWSAISSVAQSVTSRQDPAVQPADHQPSPPAANAATSPAAAPAVAPGVSALPEPATAQATSQPALQ